MNSSKNVKSGFTLIELLVVVAIIGILASIILVASGRARNEGADAGIKSNLNTIRGVSEIFFLNNGNSYLPAGTTTVLTLGTCPPYSSSGTSMLSINQNINDAIMQATKLGSGVNACVNTTDYWAVAIGLKLDPNTSWCVDNSGAAKTENFPPASAINPSTSLCY